MTKYIDFAATATDAPLSLDCADRTVALAALKHVAEVGLTDRVIFNSINPRTKPDVYAALREAKVTSVILLTLNERMPTVSGRLDVLDRAYTANGMITNLQEAGIENILVDTTVLAIPDLGPASKAIYLVKEKYGFPAGCGAHNALERWKERKKLDQKTQTIGSVAIHVMPITMGADFLLYGPISNAPDIFMACALTDAYVAYLMRQHYRINPLTRDHPLLKIFT